MLNRFSLLVALALCLAISAQGQVSVGATVGTNYSFWNWYIKNINTDLDLDPGFGYRAAAVADWRMGQVVGLRAELGYQIWRSSTTVKFTFPSDPVDVDGNYSERFHNWTGSLLASVTPFAQKRIYFLAGATAATITEAWKTVSVAGGPEPISPNAVAIDLKNYNRSQFFADFGAGVRFPVGANGALLAEVRYQLALTNLASVTTVDAGVNALGLNVGYLFQL